jgi:hypothetical protein
MKLSKKLLLGLLLTFMVLVVINAFSLKSKWEKTDKNNPFLNYQKLSNRSFKYLKVNAPYQATGRVNIGSNEHSELYVSHNWADMVKFKFNNDTLFVDFLRDSKGKTFSYDNFQKLVIITSPKITSIETKNISVEIDSLGQDQIKLVGKGYGSFEFRKMNIMDFDIALSGNSSCNFYVPEVQKIASLKAKLADKSHLNIRALMPENIFLENGLETGLEMNGATLKLLGK